MSRDERERYPKSKNPVAESHWRRNRPDEFSPEIEPLLSGERDAPDRSLGRKRPIAAGDGKRSRRLFEAASFSGPAQNFPSDDSRFFRPLAEHLVEVVGLGG